jgi:hypothetical protein
MTQTDIDPMDAAMEAGAAARPRTFFGRVLADAYFCVLRKGQGKATYNPNEHSVDDRRTAFTIQLDPVPTSKAKFAVKREGIAESKEWASIIKPSLKALNTDLRAVNNKWAQVELVPTGRKYTNSQGEEKEQTTVKFLRVFDTEAECEAAEQEFFASAQSTPTTAAASAAPAPSGSDAEKATAAKFLPALWAAAGKDVSVFAEKIAGNPLTSKYFDISSPEVVALIS